MIAPSGNSSIQRFSLTDKQTWELLLAPEEVGDYQLTLRIASADKQGSTKHIVPRPLSFTYPDEKTFFADIDQPRAIEKPKIATIEKPHVEEPKKSQEPQETSVSNS